MSSRNQESQTRRGQGSDVPAVEITNNPESQPYEFRESELPAGSQRYNPAKGGQDIAFDHQLMRGRDESSKDAKDASKETKL
jgi:hypothetical protein